MNYSKMQSTIWKKPKDNERQLIVQATQKIKNWEGNFFNNESFLQISSIRHELYLTLH